MATLILTAAGQAIGGPIGGAVGAVIGRSLDSAIFAPKPRQGPRLGDLAVQTSSYGTAIPKLFGTMRVAGTVIWSTDLIERRATSGGGKGRPKTIDYSYSASFAVALSARPVLEVRRIWADGKLLRGDAGDFKSKAGFRLHQGGEDQEADPLIAAAEGAGRAPAFRGLAYAMFEELELADFGNRIPSLTFEVVADPQPIGIGAIAGDLSGGAVDFGGTPALLGYAAGGDSVRGAVEELAELVPLSLIDTGSTLRLELAPAEPVSLARSRESGRRELVRRAAAGVPGEVSVAYYDSSRDFQTGLQRAMAGAHEARPERRALAAALTADMAKGFAERRLDTLWAARVGATVTCSWTYAHVRPGTRVRLAGESGLWRVRRWTLDETGVKLELVGTGGAAAPAADASAGRPVSEPDLPHGPTVLRLHDLPISGASAEQPTLVALAAGAEPGWRRAQLSASFDGGASWTDLGSTPPAAAIGSVLTVLPPGDAALFDAIASVEIELLNEGMELLSRDDDALIAGANLALIGDELIQFGRADPIGPCRYRLSRLLRGRRGSEWAAGTHQPGEDFALIEAVTAGPVTLPPGFGIGGQVRLLASGVGDPAPVEARAAVSGEALRPPSPVHLRARAAANGDVTISWVRRSRLGWTWSSGGDTPLGEEREAYRVTLSGGDFSRSIDLAAGEYVYSAAQAAEDGPGPVAAEVVQLGTHGVSRAAAITDIRA